MNCYLMIGVDDARHYFLFNLVKISWIHLCIALKPVNQSILDDHLDHILGLWLISKLLTHLNHQTFEYLISDSIRSLKSAGCFLNFVRFYWQFPPLRNSGNYISCVLSSCALWWTHHNLAVFRVWINLNLWGFEKIRPLNFSKAMPQLINYAFIVSCFWRLFVIMLENIALWL